MNQTKRFNFRCDQAFLDAVDDWRRKQSPIPSQSEAIRVLAMRSAALDTYFPTILKNSVGELISAGYFSGAPEPEIYERFHSVVTASLDKAADLEKASRLGRKTAVSETADGGTAGQETPSQGASEPSSRRYSR